MLGARWGYTPALSCSSCCYLRMKKDTHWTAGCLKVYNTNLLLLLRLLLLLLLLLLILLLLLVLLVLLLQLLLR